MPAASIIIVTRNRKEMAKVAVDSALAQEGDIEVIVIDDASTDGTAEYLQAHCPRARIDRAEVRTGYIVQRSRAAELSRAPVLVSIDDDAYFLEPTATLQTLALFDDSLVGAVAISFVNKQADGSDKLMLEPAADDGSVRLTNTFIGTAYAVRRDVFQQLGGFNPHLFHWGEETEYCQRLLNAGYLVRLGTRTLIRHCPGWTGKYTREVQRYVYRNRILVPWLNAPLQYLFPLLFVQTVGALKRFLVGPPDRLAALQGLLVGYGVILRGWKLRKAVSVKSFRLYMRLRKNVGMRVDDLDAALVPSRNS